MAPIPPENTKRYRMDYTVAGQLHGMTARCSSAQTDATAISYFNALFGAIGSSLSTATTWQTLQVAVQGSTIFNPVAGWTPQTGSGSGISTINYPRSLCFPGRTPTARRAKVFVYGIGDGYSMPATYEEDPIVTATFAAFQALLNSQSDFWLGIDNVKAVWYNRITVKQNDHFVDALR